MLLLDTGAERPVGRGNGLWEVEMGRAAKEHWVLVWTVAWGHQIGVGGVAGALVCHQRQSVAQPTTTSGLAVCGTSMYTVEAGVQDSWTVAQHCDSRV